MIASDRYTVRSFTATGTANLGGIQGWGALPMPLYGAQIYAQATGNFEANLLADPFGDGGYIDVTTFFYGAATFTQAKKFASVPGFLPWSLRVNVTSVQAANSVRFAVSY
jgi:hypothetical protein